MSVANTIFRSFIQAGIECSTHINVRGKRLDLLRTTQHECFAREDYLRLRQFGIQTVRNAARWHLIEQTPGSYNFESLDCVLDPAEECGLEIILDILHFGVPHHVDVLSHRFPDDFAQFTRAFVQYLKRRTQFCPIVAPVNEVSFMSWAGAEKAAISPFVVNQGRKLKRNLIKAAVAASEILLNEIPGVRLIWPEPAIHIVGDPAIPGDVEEAKDYTLAYFEAWDMLSGRLAPELGGRPEYLDVIGVNFYWRNEWVHNSGPISRHDPRWRPLRTILEDVWNRYGRPLFISETGTEDEYRGEWFDYICNEVSAALRAGVPVKGICWYPIFNHPGWDDDRHCHNGLFDYADEVGNREVHRPLAESILRQQERFAQKVKTTYDSERTRHDLLLPSSMGVCLPAAPAFNEPV